MPANMGREDMLRLLLLLTTLFHINGVCGDVPAPTSRVVMLEAGDDATVLLQLLCVAAPPHRTQETSPTPATRHTNASPLHHTHVLSEEFYSTSEPVSAGLQTPGSLSPQPPPPAADEALGARAEEEAESGEGEEGVQAGVDSSGSQQSGNLPRAADGDEGDDGEVGDKRRWRSVDNEDSTGREGGKRAHRGSVDNEVDEGRAGERIQDKKRENLHEGKKLLNKKDHVNKQHFATSRLFTPRPRVAGTRDTLPTARDTLPTARATLPTARDTLPTARDTLPTARATLPTARATLPTARATLPTARDTLPTARDTLPTARDTLPTARDTLPTTNEEEHQAEGITVNTEPRNDESGEIMKGPSQTGPEDFIRLTSPSPPQENGSGVNIDPREEVSEVSWHLDYLHPALSVSVEGARVAVRLRPSFDPPPILISHSLSFSSSSRSSVQYQSMSSVLPRGDAASSPSVIFPRLSSSSSSSPRLSSSSSPRLSSSSPIFQSLVTPPLAAASFLHSSSRGPAVSPVPPPGPWSPPWRGSWVLAPSGPYSRPPLASQTTLEPVPDPSNGPMGSLPRHSWPPTRLLGATPRPHASDTRSPRPGTPARALAVLQCRYTRGATTTVYIMPDCVGVVAGLEPGEVRHLCSGHRHLLQPQLTSKAQQERQAPKRHLSLIGKMTTTHQEHTQHVTSPQQPRQVPPPQQPQQVPPPQQPQQVPPPQQPQQVPPPQQPQQVPPPQQPQQVPPPQQPQQVPPPQQPQQVPPPQQPQQVPPTQQPQQVPPTQQPQHRHPRRQLHQGSRWQHGDHIKSKWTTSQTSPALGDVHTSEPRRRNTGDVSGGVTDIYIDTTFSTSAVSTDSNNTAVVVVSTASDENSEGTEPAPVVKHHVRDASGRKDTLNYQGPSEVVEESGGRLRRPSRDLGLSPYAGPESAPQLHYTHIEQTVSPGSPVSLKCSAVGTPPPVVTWTRDHRPLLPSHSTSERSSRTPQGEVVSVVNLSSVTAREGGYYTCTAKNVHGSVAHTARLNVYGPPFVRAMDNVTAMSGEDVRLWCPAGGYPTPSISWRRDGHPLPTSLRQDIVTNGTLIVRNAGNEDAGRYTCVVTGRQGQTASSHVFLHVLKPPKIEPFSFRSELQEGERTQLTCMINSGDLPITINWLKDSRHLQHDPGIDIKSMSDYSKVLLFKKLREHHSGSYTCEAANAAATVNYTAAVRVKVSPRWVVEPASATALVGSTVVLDCSARGYPVPELTWMRAPGEAAKDFQAVGLDGRRASQAPNGSLVLPDVSTSSAGWFLCSAANTVGKPISKVVQLTVHAPARVVTEGRRVTGHAGQTVMVDCEATGDDPLTLTWHRHHAPVSQGHRTTVRQGGMGGTVRAVLEIRAVAAADAGPYTCRAINSHGEHFQVFDIAVIEPPTAPTGVTVSEVGSRSARLTWILPQPAAITIQYRAAEGESWVSHGRNVSVGQWASWHVLTSLTPYHTYAVRLMAHNDLGVSQPSQTHIFTTLEEAPTGAPRDVRVAAGGPHSLLVTWRAPVPHLTHGPLRGYSIALRRQNLQGHLTYITRPVTAPAGDVEGVEQYEVRDLTPASLYEVAVRAFTRAGPGPLSSPRIVDATSHDAPSCPPAGVSCRGSGRGSVRVWWSPPPTHCVPAPVSGYTIVATPTKHAHHTTSGSTWEVNTTNLEKNLDGLPPATNVSVRVRAFNEVGFSPSNDPVFCVTEDDVPGPPRRVRVIVTGGTTLLVTWSPPYPRAGTILHYTLYSARDDQVAVRDVVGAGGSEATWRELSGLIPASRVQVWVTATTVAGEGSQSPRLTALPTPTPTHTPVAVGGGRSWWVGSGSGVTLGCRGLGSPPPVISWMKDSVTLGSTHHTQLLPGGDLHLTAVRESANYTCWVRNSVGVDSLTHQVVAVTAPPPPTLTFTHATHYALNLTINQAGDGGAPILGYTVHHRQRAGEWAETGVDPGVRSLVVRGLPCGAPHHLYLTAWNTYGTSAPSPVLLASTLGSPPGRPDPAKVVEINATCVTLRLYIWPELGCPITHWKVELGNEEAEVPWKPLYTHVNRDTNDLGLCDLTSATWHLLRITAASTAGDTSVVYRVATRDPAGGSMAAESVQEVLVSNPTMTGGWLDAHVVAGAVSALLLATALIICLCVAVRRRRYGGYRPGKSLDNKGGGEEDNARNSELTRAHLYSPTPTKKPHGSLASLKTQDDTSDPYEICPYATFSERHSQQSPAYGQVPRQRAQSHYKETEIAYISNRSRAEYGSRPKSLPAAQPTPTSTPAPAGDASEQRAWPEDPRKDTRSRPHRSRSRSRGTDTSRRDSSTESNDASSPVQQPQRQHYQHPQMPPKPHHLSQQLAAQQQQQQQQAAVRVGPHPLPPVRHARVPSESSSSEASPLTPPRPLHPPTAFSDSRELSEAECDREMAQDCAVGEGPSAAAAGGRCSGSGGQSAVDSMPAELTVLLQRYKQHLGHDAQHKQQKLQRGPQKNPYSINV
ncbi:cell adhesion molecule Dscam2 isoform X2 [Procambarus clarkii]|uniref:cell adhesion molecule Dscam2 isoform X2 n=1 Tax=Procambarus clarkii TaxID=6728 RepID=UPI003743CFD7